MILLTGGGGLLGTHLRPFLNGHIAPGRNELDVRSPQKPEGVDMIVHAAAYTDVANAENEWRLCYATNVEGTGEMASLGVPMVYISTEYVFDGQRGNYAEGDAPNPVNWYSATKLYGERAARSAPDSLVIRCLFKPRPFKHPAAITDQWTTGDYVDVMAPIIAEAIGMFRAGKFDKHDTIHIGTDRKSTYDLARQTREVRPINRAEVAVRLPKDTSLDITRWKSLKSAST